MPGEVASHQGAMEEIIPSHPAILTLVPNKPFTPEPLGLEKLYGLLFYFIFPFQWFLLWSANSSWG